MMQTTSLTTRKLTTMAMLTAIAIVLVALIHFPIIPGVTFLEYDPADVPIFIGMFLFGPWAGLLLTAVVSVIQGLTVSAAGGPIGIVMHILATGTYVVIGGLIYHKLHSRKGAVIALAVGTVAMTVVMCFCNLILTPIFMGQPMEAVIRMLLPVIIPFNLAKAGINSLITYIIYKPISKLFGKKTAIGKA